MAIDKGRRSGKKRNMGNSIAGTQSAASRATIMSTCDRITEDKGSTLQIINNNIQAKDQNATMISCVSFQSIIQDDEHKTAFSSMPNWVIADAIRPLMGQNLLAQYYNNEIRCFFPFYLVSFSSDPGKKYQSHVFFLIGSGQFSKLINVFICIIRC